MIEVLVKLIIVLLPFMKVIGGINISLADIFMPIVVLILVFNKIKLSKKILIFSVTLIASISLSLYISFIKFGNLHLNSLINMMKIIINIVYLNIFYNYIKYFKNGFEVVISTWKLAAIIQAVLGIIGFVIYNIDKGSSLFMYANRVRGTFEDPNLYATYLLFSLGICILDNLTKCKLAICSGEIILLVGAALSGSRASIISIGIVIFTLIIGTKNIKNKSSVILLFLILLIMMLNTDIFNTTITRLTEVNTGSDIRFKLWSFAINIISTNIIFGVGIGNFMWVANKFFNANISNITHNTYLGVMVENGIVTTVLFLGMYVYILQKLIKYKHKRSENLGLIISIIVLGVSFLSLNLENFRGAWIIIAISLAKIEINKNIQL